MLLRKNYFDTKYSMNLLIKKLICHLYNPKLFFLKRSEVWYIICIIYQCLSKIFTYIKYSSLMGQCNYYIYLIHVIAYKGQIILIKMS